LNDVGIKIHDDDKNKMKEAVTQLKSYEADLAKICIVLSNLVKLARFYNIPISDACRSNPREIKLSEIQDQNGIKDFIRGYVKDLSKNMVTNMSIQQATSYELMNKIVPRFFDDYTGRCGQNNTNSNSNSSSNLVSI